MLSKSLPFFFLVFCLFALNGLAQSIAISNSAAFTEKQKDAEIEKFNRALDAFHRQKVRGGAYAIDGDFSNIQLTQIPWAKAFFENVKNFYDGPVNDQGMSDAHGTIRRVAAHHIPNLERIRPLKEWIPELKLELKEINESIIVSEIQVHVLRAVMTKMTKQLKAAGATEQEAKTEFLNFLYENYQKVRLGEQPPGYSQITSRFFLDLALELGDLRAQELAQRLVEEGQRGIQEIDQMPTFSWDNVRRFMGNIFSSDESNLRQNVEEIQRALDEVNRTKGTNPR